MPAPFPMVPDYGWRRDSYDIPTAGEQVVVTDVEHERYGHVGLLRHDEAGRQTVTVGYGCELIGFYRRDVRRLSTNDQPVVKDMAA